MEHVVNKKWTTHIFGYLIANIDDAVKQIHKKSFVLLSTSLELSKMLQTTWY